MQQPVSLKSDRFRRDNEIIELPPREYSLFELLALKRGSLVSRRQAE